MSEQTNIPPPPVATPPARTLASELYELVMNAPTDPATVPQFGSGRCSYLDGFRDARHAITEALLAHPALQQPAPAAADGAARGERRWMMQFKGGLGVMCCLQPEDLPEASGGMPVPVRVTVEADDTAGQGTRMWTIRHHPGDVLGSWYHDRESAEAALDQWPSARVVEVLVLADDAGAARAEGAEQPPQIKRALRYAVAVVKSAAPGAAWVCDLEQRAEAVISALAAAESRAREAEALRAERNRLHGAVQQCLDAMEMFDKRQSGALEIPGETALCIWRDAQVAARAAMSSKPRRDGHENEQE